MTSPYLLRRPRSLEEALDTTSEDQPFENAVDGKGRILVIEDDPTTLNLIVRATRQAGYAVYGMADGRRAVEWLLGNQVELVVSDLFMPEGDGIEVMRFVKRHRPMTRILIISGGTQLLNQDYLKFATLLGADRVLAKPFRPGEMLNVIAELLGR